MFAAAQLILSLHCYKPALSCPPLRLPSMPRIPDLPGTPVPHNSDQERWLKRYVANLCRLDHERCVARRYLSSGSPRISLLAKISRESARELCGEGFGQAGSRRVRPYHPTCPSGHRNISAYCSYWVAEKSDGIRVLLLVQTDTATNDQMVYLVSSTSIVCTRCTNASQIDRHNTYRQLTGLYFPHHEDPRMPLRNTLVDGELVIDVDPRTKQVCESVPLCPRSFADFA